MGFTTLILFTLCIGSSFVFEYRVVTNQACFGELVHTYFESPLFVFWLVPFKHSAVASSMNPSAQKNPSFAQLHHSL